LTVWRELWQETAELLDDRAAARWLCEEACGLDGDEFLGALDETVTQRMMVSLDSMLARYRAGEPLQYVLGRWQFRRLDLLVDRRVLIPRPETELLVEVALGCIADRPAPLVVADLGTGSGAVGLSLAVELPLDAADVWLTDVSDDALDVARANLAGIGRHGSRVHLAQGDWFGALPEELRGRLDLITSNPPYVASDDPDIDPSVAAWEPHVALFADGEGYAALRALAEDAPQWLAPGGWIAVEIGSAQGSSAAALFAGQGLDEVEVRQDLTGRDRFVIGRRPGARDRVPAR
jgi:release factor glutamine methyltransferase